MCGGFKFTEFQADCLEAHNDYRIRHGSPRLDLDKGLCEFAQDWANYLRDCDILKRAKTCEYGENIYFKCSERKVYPDAYEPVKQWYNEGRSFDPKKSYPVKEIKHFSQIIWRATKAMGVAYAMNEYVCLFWMTI
jgi:glioma pathogenesis-related protein 2